MRIAIIEDQLVLREALHDLCERKFGHCVVAESGLGAEAVALVRAQRPELLLLDLSLPQVNGFAIATEILSARLPVRILVLSAHCDAYTVFRLERIGVQGYLDKNSNTAAVLGEAIETVGAGRCFYSPAFRRLRNERLGDPKAFSKLLTDWECALLCHIGRGWTDAEIGAHFNLSARTVQGHRSIIMRKLAIPSTPKLIAFAYEQGFNHDAAVDEMQRG